VKINRRSAFSFAQMQLHRLFRLCAVVFTVAGADISMAGLALPPLTVTADSYSSIVNSSSNDAASQSYLVFVRRAAFIPMPYQLYDGEEMISAGQGSDLCHVYQTSAGKHSFGLSFIAGTGTAGSIPRLRFRFVEAELAPNKVYYLSVNIGDTFLGGFIGGLQPISARLRNNEDLPKWLATCKLVKFDIAAAKKEWVERYSADFKPMFEESFHEWQIQPKKVELLAEDGFSGFLAVEASP